MDIEPIIRFYQRMNNSQIKIATPAIVVGVQELKDGFIDVLPLVNYENPLTLDTTEHGVISRVPVVFPSNLTSTICFPVVQGDTVELIFHSSDITKFVNGNTEQYNPTTTGVSNLSTAVARVGFNPYQDSCFNANNYQADFNMDDLNIVHNKKTENEISLRLTKDGDVKISTPNKVTVEAKEVDVVAENVIIDSSTIDAKNSLIKTDNDVEVKGISFYKFATQHTHSGVESGSSTTAPPNTI